MPKYVQVAAHLNPDELEQQYRQAVDPVERSHFQIIWLLACGKRVREVAEVTGYCANWIRILVRRYNQEGPTAFADQRQHNSGASPLLTGAHRQQLQRLLMAACGLVLKLPVGWASSLDGLSILNAAGSISSELASPSKFPGHVTTKPIQRSKRRSSASYPNRSDRFSRAILLPR